MRGSVAPIPQTAAVPVSAGATSPWVSGQHRGLLFQPPVVGDREPRIKHIASCEKAYLCIAKMQRSLRLTFEVDDEPPAKDSKLGDAGLQASDGLLHLALNLFGVDQAIPDRPLQIETKDRRQARSLQHLINTTRVILKEQVLEDFLCGFDLIDDTISQLF